MLIQIDLQSWRFEFFRIIQNNTVDNHMEDWKTNYFYTRPMIFHCLIYSYDITCCTRTFSMKYTYILTPFDSHIQSGISSNSTFLTSFLLWISIQLWQGDWNLQPLVRKLKKESVWTKCLIMSRYKCMPELSLNWMYIHLLLPFTLTVLPSVLSANLWYINRSIRRYNI